MTVVAAVPQEHARVGHGISCDSCKRAPRGSAAFQVKDAADFQFHPGQNLEWQKDGSLIVRFRARPAILNAFRAVTSAPIRIVDPTNLIEALIATAPDLRVWGDWVRKRYILG
jgi:hypothetical protein